MPSPALCFQEVSKKYLSSDGATQNALRNISFEIPAGRKVAVIGRSGSGKSTLLHLAAGLDIPTDGVVTLDGQNLAQLSERERTLLRRRGVGLVFQFFHLLPHLSVFDNVALPELIAGGSGYASRVHDLLSRVGLANRAKDSVQKLSGGEMQRVALCRALLPKPRLLLADEPTGNLDDDNSRRVMELLMALASDEKATLLFVTHSRELASMADDIWTLHSGRLDPQG